MQPLVVMLWERYGLSQLQRQRFKSGVEITRECIPANAGLETATTAAKQRYPPAQADSCQKKEKSRVDVVLPV